MVPLLVASSKAILLTLLTFLLSSSLLVELKIVLNLEIANCKELDWHVPAITWNRNFHKVAEYRFNLIDNTPIPARIK